MKQEKKLYSYIEKNYNLFDNLCKRLQDDYNNIKDFEQHEEDRLIIYTLLEIIDN